MKLEFLARSLVVASVIALSAALAEAGGPQPTPYVIGPDCVALLGNCASDSAPIEFVCGSGSHTVASSDGASFAKFGSQVDHVILTQCDTNDTLTIKGNTNFCDLPGGDAGPGHWNDAVCSLEIVLAAPVTEANPAPAADTMGLSVLILALSAAGATTLWRTQKARAASLRRMGQPRPE